LKISFKPVQFLFFFKKDKILVQFLIFFKRRQNKKNQVLTAAWLPLTCTAKCKDCQPNRISSCHLRTRALAAGDVNGEDASASVQLDIESEARRRQAERGSRRETHCSSECMHSACPLLPLLDPLLRVRDFQSER
jgi:hypothetical protein